MFLSGVTACICRWFTPTTDFLVIAMKKQQLEMWANAQHDGRPAEYRWRPLFNAAKFG